MIIRRETKSGSNDINVVYRPCKIEELIGNETNKRIIKNALDEDKVSHTQLFTGDAGCVDCDTEFLSPQGWKKISEYDDELVMQYNIDGTSEFVKPVAYIKRNSEKLNVVETKYGVSQCLSGDHRVLYFTDKRQPVVEYFSDIKEKHRKLKMGFRGKFKTVFSPKINGSLPISENELRVQVMVIADTNFLPARKKCCLNLKKIRKIERAELLLKAAGIEFDRYEMSNGYTRFYFVPPMRCKEFGPEFFKCSKEQLSIVFDEVFNWDGYKDGQQFYSNSKISADFIQYVAAANNKRSTIYYDTHKENVCYTVTLSNNTLVGLKGNKYGKPEIKEVNTKDGYEYCFKVPSSFLVLRRDNKIFITGNCGKTTAAKIIALGLNCETNGVSSAPCLECPSCRSILEGNSQDVKEINVGQEGGKAYVDSIVRDLPYAPFNTRYKVIIFDEADELTAAAKDLLLKPTENGYDHVYFIFCTNQPEKLKSKKKDAGEAFLSRCSTLNFKRIDTKLLQGLVRNVCDFEGYPANNEVLDLIVEEAKGVPRTALVRLNQVATEGSWTLSAAKEICEVWSEEDDPQVKAFCQALNKGSFIESVTIYDKITNLNAESLRIPVSYYFTSCLRNSKKVPDARKFSAILDEVNIPIYEQGRMANPRWYNLIFKITDIVNSAKNRRG
jgi:DNA polymerase III delta prime subunit